VRRIYLFILPCILVACGLASPGPAVSPTGAHGQMATPVPGFAMTKLFLLTAEAETMTAGIPKNDVTVTAIMANKYVVGTAMAETMTAMPTSSPLPTVPPGSPFCSPADLKTSFQTNAATQSILLGVGLTNIHGKPCFLQAWPQLALTDSQGQPLDVDYNYYDTGAGDAVSAATEQAREALTAKVGIWPGWTAWLNLIWMNWCGEPIPGGVIIRLRLREDTGSIDIPTGMQTGGNCNAPGYRSTIGISKFQLSLPPQ